MSANQLLDVVHSVLTTIKEMAKANEPSNARRQIGSRSRMNYDVNHSYPPKQSNFRPHQSNMGPKSNDGYRARVFHRSAFICHVSGFDGSIPKKQIREAIKNSFKGVHRICFPSMSATYAFVYFDKKENLLHHLRKEYVKTDDITFKISKRERHSKLIYTGKSPLHSNIYSSKKDGNFKKVAKRMTNENIGREKFPQTEPHSDTESSNEEN